ncbi:TetR/AcrR family transcriptional regulator [Arthrobacter sp. NPDC090010]|uniref:TetR/AcrR family transcriptional regulator n=1 Tax=Arthrobacter sp. NPDC090010 TaxID=3363942 RepID=UPI0038248B86
MSKDQRINPAAARSRAALLDAVTELLSLRPASEISIKDVVEAAGMSRPTFYQHFTDLGTLFATAGLTRLEGVFAGLESRQEQGTDPEAELTALFAELVGRMSEHAHFYARVQESAGGAAFHAAVVRTGSDWLRQEPQLRGWIPRDEDAWDFLAAGVVWIITRYLAESCQVPDTPRPEALLAHTLLAFTGRSAAH